MKKNGLDKRKACISALPGSGQVLKLLNGV